MGLGTEPEPNETAGAIPANEPVRPGRPLVEVALTPSIPAKGCLTYSVPDELLARPLNGMRVRVPLGRGSRTGVVIRSTVQAPPAPVKSICECLDPEPFLNEQILDLCTWTARYYMVNLAEVVATIVPTHAPRARLPLTVRLLRRLSASEETELRRRGPRLWAVYRAASRYEDTPVPRSSLEGISDWRRAARRLSQSGIIEVVRTAPHPQGGLGEKLDSQDSPPPEATPEQSRAIEALRTEIAESRFRVFLLFGVTSSGKTNVYLAAAKTAIATGRSVLFLIPEIALTHEIAERARAQFGSRVALLHSALSPGERWSEWARVRRGEATVVVGPRSAVFAPLGRLGLVIVDEEHDPSYKQEEGVRYNGRDLAVVRAQTASCPVVLGSATPSVESFLNAQSGRYTLLELPERAKGSTLPKVSLLDVRGRTRGSGADLCSEELVAAMESNLRQGGQTLLFLNRRGFAHFVQCMECGEPATCVACSVTLTLHRSRRALVCHHCGFVRPSHAPCANCGAPQARGGTPGTEQVEAALAARFPGHRIARMDRDSTGRRGAQERLLRAWHAGEIDILVGTQMITKGVDNPRVTLVGVLDADISLNLPDFRAAERTLQLVTQVAGRAGRGNEPGSVLVQTLRPDHYSLRAAAAHDYRAFFASEIEWRRALGYPPFRRLINVRFEARDATRAERIARDFATRIRARPAACRDGIEVLGPAPAPIERLRGWHRWQALVRGTRSTAMRSLVEYGRSELSRLRGAGRARIIVDVDPCSML